MSVKNGKNRFKNKKVVDMLNERSMSAEMHGAISIHMTILLNAV